ncbi:MAG: flagellar biosynthesis anti-sigma factor FlgM [Stenotrophobium sp.]
MVTKIDSYLGNIGSAARTSSKTVETIARGGANDNGVSKTSRPDSIHLTPDALQLHQFEKSIAGLPVANQQRIAAIKASLENGSYHINPQAIASRLTGMEQDIARLS